LFLASALIDATVSLTCCGWLLLTRVSIAIGYALILSNSCALSNTIAIYLLISASA